MVMLKTSPKHRGALFLANKELSLVSQPLPPPHPFVACETSYLWSLAGFMLCVLYDLLVEYSDDRNN